ncbi:hypothetical protein [Amphibacillus jilinensis]|uniref:hypothetical protein n=1 Tax=Amphibacillus jilinensis TaxID=1216008 RepID=UPI00031946DF|nr:hypothetical protein [Amphibacillus jilinensis]
MEQFSVRLINPDLPSVTVKGIKVLSYNEKTGIMIHLNDSFRSRLTSEQSEQLIWTKATGVCADADTI